MRFLHKLGRPRIVDREAFLVEISRGRRVMHLGCVDAGLLDERINNDELLHAKLAHSSNDLWGLDVCGPGIERLRALGYPNLFTGSAEDPPAGVPRRFFDVVVLGELIEHVRNVGKVLDASYELLRAGGVVVITTPNAFRFSNAMPVLFGFELVHPDHLTWFSPQTLRQSVRLSGLSLREMLVYRNRATVAVDSSHGPLNRTLRAVYNCVIALTHPVLTRAAPFTADGLVVVAERPDEAPVLPDAQ